MLFYNEIKIIHLEITSKCNARCPQCPRNINGGITNPNLPLTELYLDHIKKLLLPNFIKQLDELFMCGNYGDPIVARDTLPVFNYLRHWNSSMKLMIHTNGSAKTTKWWREIASFGCTVRFGIDGLEDTNHIYRRGTNWSTIVNNAKAFIKSGGNAEWCFIVFKHNEHQIDEAKKLAENMGFKKFIVKRTKRFHYLKNSAKLQTDVLSRDGTFEYFIEPPSDDEYQVASNESLYNDNGDKYLDHLLSTQINCQSASKQMIFISAEGLIFPCCYLGEIHSKNQNLKTGQIWELINRLPQKENSINGIIHGIQSVVDGPFFQKMIPNCWLPAEKKENRLITCAITCGKTNENLLTRFSF
jgi:MoaA/NifB/PqqE/SkfB family radical SAM enzyme